MTQALYQSQFFPSRNAAYFELFREISFYVISPFNVFSDPVLRYFPGTMFGNNQIWINKSGSNRLSRIP